MERKKLIRLAIFVIIIIVVIIIVENSIRGIGNIIEEKKENERLEEQREKYENSEQYKEEILLEAVVDDIVELLNNNDIEKLYNLLDADYKDYKFQNNRELFEEYIKQYVNNDSKISLQTYEKISGRYVCRLLAESDGHLKSFVTLITENEDGSYNLIFDDITGIKKVNKNYINNINLNCEILYNVTAEQILIYAIEFTNMSDKNMNYTYNNVVLKDTYGNNFTIDTDNLKISLKPGESLRQDLIFYDSRIHNFPKTALNIDLKDEKDTINSLSIYLGSGI